MTRVWAVYTKCDAGRARDCIGHDCNGDAHMDRNHEETTYIESVKTWYQLAGI